LSITADDVDAIADRLLAASAGVASIAPITDALSDFDLSDAYRVAAAVTQRRIARGERPVGWKIGFTNRTIWDEYDVYAPIWGPMYDSTVGSVDPGDSASLLPIAGFIEPRIEPEIAFRIAAPPHPDMDERELIACVDAAAHGVEIVQSPFPGWRFKAADTVAAFALHGCYRHGGFVPIASAERPRWLEMLTGFEIALFKNGVEADRGIAGNVLGGGPLTALRHLVRGVIDFPAGYKLGVGDIVTTGTVTRAFPVKPGERWSTKITGLPLPGLDLRLV
jgi:2-oxo-3-hexenedioate decarboxylase